MIQQKICPPKAIEIEVIAGDFKEKLRKFETKQIRFPTINLLNIPHVVHHQSVFFTIQLPPSAIEART